MNTGIPFYISSAFTGLTFLLFLLIAWAINSASPKLKVKSKFPILILSGLTIWLFILFIISNLHILDQWSAMPPRLILVILLPLIFAIFISTSGRFVEFIKAIPQHWLILIQSFRIIMELILLGLYIENIIPVQMTFEGRNFDILAGITALLVGYLVWKNKISNKLIIAWNVFGLILLANIVIVAVLSLPTPLRVFMNEPANTVVAYFPFIWLPGFVVPVALTMHFVSIRKALLN